MQKVPALSMSGCMRWASIPFSVTCSKARLSVLWPDDCRMPMQASIHTSSFKTQLVPLLLMPLAILLP